MWFSRDGMKSRPWFGTFKNNTVSEHFRKIRFHYLTPSLCTPKMMTVLEHFQKIRFRYLTPPSPLHPKMTLTISLWNIMKPNPFWNNNLLEPFRIILFRKVSERYAFVTHSLPLHPKNDDCFGTFLNDTLSLPYSPPPTSSPKWHSLAYKPNIWTFRKDKAFVTLLLLHCTQNWHLLSNKSNSRTFQKDNLSLPYSFPSPTAPQNDPRYLIDRTSERFGKIRFLYLTSPPLHPKNDIRYLIYRTS